MVEFLLVGDLVVEAVKFLEAEIVPACEDKLLEAKAVPACLG